MLPPSNAKPHRLTIDRDGNMQLQPIDQIDGVSRPVGQGTEPSVLASTVMLRLRPGRVTYYGRDKMAMTTIAVG